MASILDFWAGRVGGGRGGAQGRDRGRQRYSELNSSLSVLFWKVISKMKKTFLKKAAAAKIEAVRRARERKRKELEELGKVYDGEVIIS